MLTLAGEIISHLPDPNSGSTGFDVRWNGSVILSGAGNEFFSPNRLVSSRGGSNKLDFYANAYKVWDGNYSQVEGLSLWAMEMKK